MHRFHLLRWSALVLLLGGGLLSHALTIKPNVAPVATAPIGDRQQYDDVQ